MEIAGVNMCSLHLLFVVVAFCIGHTMGDGTSVIGGANHILKHNALTPRQRTQITDIYRRCKAPDDDKGGEHRYFGNKDERYGTDGHGHTVTFLNKCFDEDILKAVQQIARQLLKHQMETIPFPEWRWEWQHLLNDFEYGLLSPRVIEFVTYQDEAHLGWHDDNDSIMTFVALINNDTEFQGGDFLVRNLENGDADEDVVSFATGDAILFPSTAGHMVTPVTSGKREVLVIEYWYLPRNSEFASRTHPEVYVQFLRQNARMYHRKYDIEFNPLLYHWEHDQRPQTLAAITKQIDPYAGQEFVSYPWKNYYDFDNSTQWRMMDSITYDREQQLYLYHYHNIWFSQFQYN